MGVFLILFFAAVLLLAIFFRFRAYKDQLYFESKGIPYQGNGSYRMMVNMYKGVGLIEGITMMYNKLKSENKKVVGSKDLGMCTLTILDPALIRSVLVKDFDHFADRRQFKTLKNDVIFAKMLIALRGGQWKALRSKLSPTFTTGKIKRVFPMFNESGKKLVTFVENEMALSSGMEIDLMDGYSKFTMDVIASAVCGIDSQAFNQKEPSLFERMGMKMQLQFGGAQLAKLLVMLMSPRIANLLGFSFFELEVPRPHEI